MRRLLYIIIPLTLLLSSCLKEVYEDDSFEERLIVEGSIEQNGVAKVMLSLNMDYREEISEETLREKIVRSAIVYVTDLESDRREQLIGVIDKRYPTQYMYKSSALVGRVGGRYRLDIRYKGRDYYAYTSIPEPNKLYDITTEYVDDKFYRVKATLKPNAKHLPYMIQCATSFTKEEAPVYMPPALFGIIDSCYEEVTVTVNRSVDYTNILEYSTLFLWQEDVYIRFCTMSNFGYDYWSLWENCTLNSMNPVFPVDEEPPTNIIGENVAGIWQGYGVAYYCIEPGKPSSKP
jgi:hypothetical protein